MNRNRITVKQAAALIGCAPETVRYYMETGKWDIGVVVPAKGGSGRKNYFVFADKVNKLIGKTCCYESAEF